MCVYDFFFFFFQNVSKLSLQYETCLFSFIACFLTSLLTYLKLLAQAKLNKKKKERGAPVASLSAS